MTSHPRSHLMLNSDDCLFYRPIKSKDDQKKLQEDLTKLVRWADIWGVEFNPSKCSVLRVKRPCSLRLPAQRGHNRTNNLEWGDRISKIASKASSTLDFLRRNLKRCPSKLKEIAYFSMVRSLLEYSCPVWDPYRQGDIDKLNKIQVAATRFVTNNYQRKSSVTALIKDLG